MKKISLNIILSLCFGIFYGQEQNYSINTGDILIISEPSGSSYNHIKFPNKNSIIKRGAIANFNSLVGRKVVVDKIISTDERTTKVFIKREDGQKFFRFFPKVTCNLEKAIVSGELTPLQKKIL